MAHHHLTHGYGTCPDCPDLGEEVEQRMSLLTSGAACYVCDAEPASIEIEVGLVDNERVAICKSCLREAARKVGLL